MPIRDIVVISAICSMFVTFIAVLGAVSWSSGSPRTAEEAARRPHLPADSVLDGD